MKPLSSADVALSKGVQPQVDKTRLIRSAITGQVVGFWTGQVKK